MRDRGGRVLDAAVASVGLLAELVALFLAIATVVAVAAASGSAPAAPAAEQRPRRRGGQGHRAGVPDTLLHHSAIPALVAMVDAAVRTSVWVGFLLSALVLDASIVAALALIFGPLTAVLYTAVTFAGALTAALVADAMAVRAGRQGVRRRADGRTVGAC
ncbi:MAG TPA: hypothetical protein VK923_20030 [Euzebyales bacterium]|nr:hypothetical protein [Euzebyales bacterium]